jgi:hypothetical protein
MRTATEAMHDAKLLNAVLKLSRFSFRPAFLDTAKKERRVEYEQKVAILVGISRYGDRACNDGRWLSA